MKRLATFVALIGIPGIVMAQHVPVLNPSRGMIAPSNAYRYGNINFPGGIYVPYPNTHAARMGPAVSGSIPYTGVPYGSRPGRGNRTVVVPYAYPVFGGGYGYGGYYPEPQATNVTVVVPQQPAPQVIINNGYVPENSRQTLRSYDGESSDSNVKVYEGGSKRPAEPVASGRSIMDEKPNIYLLALRDGSTRQAIGYWVQGEVVHYVTPESTINHVSADMVDRQRSIDLNAERNLDFDLKLPR